MVSERKVFMYVEFNFDEADVVMADTVGIGKIIHLDRTLSRMNESTPNQQFNRIATSPHASLPYLFLQLQCSLYDFIFFFTFPTSSL